MKIFGSIIIALFVFTCMSTTVFSDMTESTAGNPQQGATHFKDNNFAGSTNGKSCNSCHPDGKGLTGVADKDKYKKSGDVDRALGKIVNQCISHALKGEPLKPNSTEMNDVVAYIKTIKEP